MGILSKMNQVFLNGLSFEKNMIGYRKMTQPVFSRFVVGKKSSIWRLVVLIVLMVLFYVGFYQVTDRWFKPDKGFIPGSATYFQPSRDTSGLLQFKSGVRAVLYDRQGRFWFGSHQEGVAYYDGAGIRYFTEADGLSDNQVRHIKESSDGTIWFECARGISYYKNGQIFSVGIGNFLFPKAWTYQPYDLWFKGNEPIDYNRQEQKPGVYRLSNGTLVFQEFPFEKQPNDPAYYSVSTPAYQGKEKVWFGTYGAVIGYGADGFTLLDNKALNLNETTGFLHVRSVFEDQSGNLWIGNNGIGVLQFDGNSFFNFSEKQGLIAPHSARGGGKSEPGTLEHVFAIGEDKEGNIWFGDRDTGAWRFDGNSIKNFSEKEGLPQIQFWCIYRDRADRLWMGLANGGVYQFDGERFERKF